MSTITAPIRRAVRDRRPALRDDRLQSTVLGVREPQASIAELLAQDAVLLLKVRDDVGLVAVHPAREH